MLLIYQKTFFPAVEFCILIAMLGRSFDFLTTGVKNTWCNDFIYFQRIAGNNVF